MNDYKINISKIYYEKNALEFDLTKNIFDEYKNIEKIPIESHNNIEELRKSENKDFGKLKNILVLGTRKTFKYVENHKISDFLVPFTSSGCYAMCMYCYLVCNFNKCSYLRLFVNQKQILDKLVKHANNSLTEYTYEIGSNSDLLLENLISKNLYNNIEYFLQNTKHGKLTFPSKFKYIEPLKDISDKSRLLPRISLNPENIINKVEFRTSNLIDRLHAINSLYYFGYKPYILIAPVIITDNFEEDYNELFSTMHALLDKKLYDKITFEVIFMTYSYVHRKINEEAFPKAINLYSEKLMTSRGVGKYHYKMQVKDYGKNYIEHLIKVFFPKATIKYIV